MRPAITALLSTALLAVVAAPALGAEGSRQKVTFKLTSSEPGAPSGQVFNVDYVNPDDPEAKPPSVRRVVAVLPRGAAYDTSAPAQCTASDAELMALGADACPAGSKVGEGVITLDTGLLGPARFITSDTTFLNNTDELIYVNTARGTSSRVIVRGEVTTRRIITEAPFLPGAPPDGAAIDTVDVTDPVLTTQRGSYITAPPHCPNRGFWRMWVRFTYADGVMQVARERSRCER